ncbi:MAG: inorganic phosphate transporter [Candidatus Latescibacterota bacterium]|nr:MAG: inorganic phosphate transporter [Candidatus Latescibacterota bacterium]
METGILWSAVAMGFIFAFTNGFHDGCNVVATAIASRSVPARKALVIASVGEFAGPWIFGTAVATTIGRGIILPATFNHGDVRMLVFSVFAGAIAWNLITWWWGLPSSSSHALIGALVGPALIVYGPQAINWWTLFWKVLLVMFATPLVGLVLAYVSMNLLIAIFSDFPPSINRFFKGVQPLGVGFLAASQGANDAPKAMGLITLGLMAATESSQNFSVPLWVMLGSASAISLGLFTGGWRILRTVGRRICRVEAIHSFNSQVSCILIIATAAILGGPVSTTQVVNSSIMGTGASRRMSAVRWHVARDIFLAWVLTVPASAVLSVSFFYLAKLVCSLG